MNTMHIAPANEMVSGKTEIYKRRRNWTRILYMCGGGGLAMSLFGLLLSAAAFFKLVENAAQVNRTGTWLMVAAFPIVMLGAHALDKIGEIDEQAKKNASRRTKKTKFTSRCNGNNDDQNLRGFNFNDDRFCCADERAAVDF